MRLFNGMVAHIIAGAPAVTALGLLVLGTLVALFSGGHVLIEPSTSLIEAGFFGWRFPVKRFIVSFIVTFLAGMLTVILEMRWGLDIL